MGFDFGDGKDEKTHIPVSPMTSGEMFFQVLKKLDERIGSKKYDSLHRKKFGLRSRQSASVIEALIDMGVITEEKVRMLG